MNRHLRRKRDQLLGRTRSRVRRSTHFRTASGAVNVIERRRHTGLLIRTRHTPHRVRRPEPFHLPWDAVSEAIGLLLVKGTLGLKDLEAAHHYTSALMGLLLTFLPGAQRLQGPRRRLYIRLQVVRVHIGGCERDRAVIEAIDQAGGAFVLMSFYHLRDNLCGRGGGPPAWYRYVKEKNLRLRVDCGVFSLWRQAKKQGRELTLEEEEAYFQSYCQFLRGPLSDVIADYFAFDVIGDWERAWWYFVRMQQMGLRPIPVYHLGEPLEYLDRLARVSWEIGLGGHVGRPEAERERFFAEVFARYPNHLFHGLGVGSGLILRFPFYSVDTTSYLVARPKQSRQGYECLVLTDQGQAQAGVAPAEALRRNVAYLVQLGDRPLNGPVQLDWTVWLDGTAAAPRCRRTAPPCEMVQAV